MLQCSCKIHIICDKQEFASFQQWVFCMTSPFYQNAQRCPSDRLEIAGSRWTESGVRSQPLRSRQHAVDQPVGNRADQSGSEDGNADSTQGCHCVACPTWTWLLVVGPWLPTRQLCRLVNLPLPATVQQSSMATMNALDSLQKKNIILKKPLINGSTNSLIRKQIQRQTDSEWVEFNAPPNTVSVISEVDKHSKYTQ